MAVGKKHVYTITIKDHSSHVGDTYRVIGHQSEEAAGRVRLVLTLEDGSTLAVPDIYSRYLHIHADLSKAEKLAERDRRKADERDELALLRQIVATQQAAAVTG